MHVGKMLQHKFLREQQSGMHLFHLMGGLFVPPTSLSASIKLNFMCLNTHEIGLD